MRFHTSQRGSPEALPRVPRSDPPSQGYIASTQDHHRRRSTAEWLPLAGRAGGRKGKVVTGSIP